jgi:hypothetical protein
MATKILASIAILLIVFVYVSYYAKYNTDIDIVQSYIDQLNPNLLYERNPIVVYEPIVDPRHLLTTLFKYQYTFSKEYTTVPGYLYIAHSKFSILYSDISDTTIQLISPINKKKITWKPAKNSTYVSNDQLEKNNIPFVDVKLKQRQVIILPSHWIVGSNTPLQKIDLNDMTSNAFFYISRP